jgi:hypothetical protein
MVRSYASIRKTNIISTCLTIILLLVSYLPLARPFSQPQPAQVTQPQLFRPSVVQSLVSGNWAGAKAALRQQDCCVVSVPGLESHLDVLQVQLADLGPADLDLRARVSVGVRSGYDDCLRLRRSVLESSRRPSILDDDDDYDNNNDSCTAALMELAQGVASLAENGPALEGHCGQDVFIRIVCASNYRAIDPMYHTDKAPLRAYVTLRGVGTDFRERPCSLWEYVTLRAFGSLGNGDPVQSGDIRRAHELEFIVMKGDHYEYDSDYESPKGSGVSSGVSTTWLTRILKRTKACVHRSPPAAASGSGRRVIISLDLADGDDDREWYQAHAKREWRSGMTQRKSRLVA